MADFLETVLSDEPPIPETEPAPEPQIEPVVEPVAQPEPEPPVVEQVAPQQGFVPMAAMLDERDKRKALEAQVAHYQTQQQPSARPDPFDDPDAYEAYLGSTLDERLTGLKFNMSAEMAKSAHGEEVVTTATNWAAERAANDPGFRVQWQQALQTSPHPMEWVVRQHKRETLLSAIGDVPSVDDWFTQEAAKRGYVAQSAPAVVAPMAAAQPAPRPAAPPRSIASEAPVSASASPNDAKAEFDAIFNQR